MLLFVAVGVIDAEERSCERCDLTEANEQGRVNLPFRSDEDAAEQEYESSEAHDGCCYELQRGFHDLFVQNYQKLSQNYGDLFRK